MAMRSARAALSVAGLSVGGLLALSCGGLARDADRETVSGTTRLDQLLEALRADIEAAAPEERRFLRYVTLMDRHDAYAAALATPGVRAAALDGSLCELPSALYDVCTALSEETSVARDLYELERERHALNKAVNSVSRQPRSIIPRALDGERLIYRLDLRDYGWATPVSVDGQEYPDGWEAIVASASQAVELEGPDADAIEEATGAAVPFLLSRVFIDTAAQGEVYYGLLRLPRTLGALEAELGVASGIGAGGTEIRRTFTALSGVSRQPRVLERRSMPDADAGFWLAYDFLRDENAEPVLREPLGSIPADGMHAMFPLPNGLQAFFSADASGQRITTSTVLESPTDVDGRAHNAVSCYGCHQRGTVQIQPYDLLAHVGAEGNIGYRERDAIAGAYPSSEVLLPVMLADNEAYAVAATRAGVSVDERDPISDVCVAFQQAHRFSAAGELFVSPELLSARLGDLPPALGPLATTGATVERPAFARAYHSALCTLLGKARNRPARCP